MPAASIRRQVSIPLADGPATFFTFAGLADPGEHIAIALGDWREKSSPLVRLHSECLTGDLFGSGLCDCGPQLSEARRRLREESGILLYLRQEGRGIGLYNKLDAYALQSEGLDTFEANRQLGWAEDARDYLAAAQMLQALGISRVRLLTNNPEKSTRLVSNGILVEERISTGVFVNENNRDYLHAKRWRKGHAIKVEGEE